MAPARTLWLEVADPVLVDIPRGQATKQPFDTDFFVTDVPNQN